MSTTGNAARNQVVRLCKGFMRVRHSFPNKQGRSKLRRWTNMMFSLRELEYSKLVEQRGECAAETQAAKWRAEAQEDLGTYRSLPVSYAPVLPI